MDGNNNEIITNYEEPKGQGTIMGKLSFIFGIVGMVFSLLVCCSWSGFPFAIAAVVLGIIGKNKDSEDGKAKLGFIFGIIGICLGIISTILSLTLNIGTAFFRQFYG